MTNDELDNLMKRAGLKLGHPFGRSQIYTLVMLALEAKDAEIAKYKALCDQLGTALDGHCAPLPGYEQEHIDALTAWRSTK